LIGQTQPYSWAETFVRDAIKSVEAKQLKVKSSKTLITALINAFGHKDPKAEPVTDSNGELVPDTDLTDYENVPYLEDIDDYFAREVLPHVPDAWLDESLPMPGMVNWAALAMRSTSTASSTSTSRRASCMILMKT
jgi:type I restriction enzyme M protein